MLVLKFSLHGSHASAFSRPVCFLFCDVNLRDKEGTQGGNRHRNLRNKGGTSKKKTICTQTQNNPQSQKLVRFIHSGRVSGMASSSAESSSVRYSSSAGGSHGGYTGSASRSDQGTDASAEYSMTSVLGASVRSSKQSGAVTTGANTTSGVATAKDSSSRQDASRYFFFYFSFFFCLF